MDYLVGYTGFVGSNLAIQHSFSGLYNSKNIRDAYGGEPDQLVYAGVRAEMFLANRDPSADYKMIEMAIENIRAIAPKQVVLISTVAVYPDTRGADEDTPIEKQKLTAYGANRRILEEWVIQNFDHHLVVRLPAIYGENLKKNFIYDYIHVIPSLLSEVKFKDLAAREPALHQYYQLQDNGFYKCGPLSEPEENKLKAVFQNLGFSALNFTDSRSKYQFYHLKNLWGHIKIALEHGIKLVNIATPPVSVSELYTALTGEKFENYLQKPPYDYDIHTKHAEIFEGSGEYLMTKEEELEEVKNFIQQKMMG